MKAFFIAMMIFLSAESSFAADLPWTFRQIVEASSVYVDLDGGKLNKSIRLYTENLSRPVVVIDFWKSGVVRRISETPLADLRADQLDLEDWQFPIQKDHKLGGDIYHSTDKYPDSYVGFTNKTAIINSNGRMWVTLDNALILGTSRRLQEIMGIYRKDLVIENDASDGGVLFKDFVEGRYPKPSYLSKCELNLMR